MSQQDLCLYALHCFLLCLSNYPRLCFHKPAQVVQRHWRHRETKPMRALCWTALMPGWRGPALPSMSLKYFCVWYLCMRLYLKDHKEDETEARGDDHTQLLTCLKVVWGAALAPVSSMYSSQLKSASSSMESASTWTKAIKQGVSAGDWRCISLKG